MPVARAAGRLATSRGAPAPGGGGSVTCREQPANAAARDNTTRGRVRRMGSWGRARLPATDEVRPPPAGAQCRRLARGPPAAWPPPGPTPRVGTPPWTRSFATRVIRAIVFDLDNTLTDFM